MRSTSADNRSRRRAVALSLLAHVGLLALGFAVFRVRRALRDPFPEPLALDVQLWLYPRGDRSGTGDEGPTTSAGELLTADSTPRSEPSAATPPTTTNAQTPTTRAAMGAHRRSSALEPEPSNTTNEPQTQEPATPATPAPRLLPSSITPDERVEQGSSSPRAPEEVVAQPSTRSPFGPSGVGVQTLPEGLNGSGSGSGEQNTNGGSEGSGGSGGAAMQARERATSYLRETQMSAFPRQIPGSNQYYRQMRDAMRDAFRPPPVLPEPHPLSFLTGGREALVEATNRSLGPLANGRGGAAMESLDHAHPNSPTLRPQLTIGGVAGATARTTRVELEVDQSDGGAIVAVRIVHRSGVTGFDRQAEAAVRAAVPGLENHAMPGGWTSRWAFEVTVERDPPIVFAGGLPGEPPAPTIAVGGDFDESTGRGTFRAPFMLHRRTNIRLLWSHPTGSR